MKYGGRSHGFGWKLPTEEEVEVVEILLDLPRLWYRSKLVSLTWGRKKKRSVLESPLVSLTQPDKSPSTPLAFLPGSSGGGDNRKPPLSGPNVMKRKATDDMLEIYNRMQQERESLMNEIKAMETLHQELNLELNLELKAKEQKVNYPRNMEDYRCHQQITMFAPAAPQMAVDPNNGEAEEVTCSSNSNGGSGFGFVNQIDPRVKIHWEPYDFMGLSQPVMGSDSRVMAVADARKRRKLRMHEKNNSLLAMKLSKSR